MIVPLDLLQYQSTLKLRKVQGQVQIFDPIRNKYLVQTPEEVVRQLFLSHLLLRQRFPKNRIRTEMHLKVNDLDKRCDILAYDWLMQPYLLVECKAPNVEITEASFRQIAAYNIVLRVSFLVVTNGRTTYCASMEYESRSFNLIGNLPYFPSATSD